MHQIEVITFSIFHQFFLYKYAFTFRLINIRVVILVDIFFVCNVIHSVIHSLIRLSTNYF